MSFVIDNSMALAWTLPDEESPLADAVLDKVVERGGYVPFIFPAEFANGLTMAIRKGRIDAAARSAAIERIGMLELVRDLVGLDRMSAAVELADGHRLTVYDALYLELARRAGLPIATLDRALGEAARRAGIPLVRPGS